MIINDTVVELIAGSVIVVVTTLALALHRQTFIAKTLREDRDMWMRRHDEMWKDRNEWFDEYVKTAKGKR